MTVKPWDQLPASMQTEAVRPYYEILRNKRGQLLLKRLFDIVVSAILLVIASPVFLILAIAIKCDSKGPVFFRQTRVTQYGMTFRIFKFRTMVDRAELLGSQVTTDGDPRITRVGRVIRDCRLDEIGQLLNVFGGSMTFVGTRPEVVRYVERYTPEMMATLLLPAGVTSEASIRYKKESELLDAADDVDRVYVEEVLPDKMKYNLDAIRSFGLGSEIKTLFRTVFAVLGKDEDEKEE